MCLWSNLLLPDYYLEIVADDAAFDIRMHKNVTDAYYAVIDPMLSPGLMATSCQEFQSSRLLLSWRVEDKIAQSAHLVHRDRSPRFMQLFARLE